MDKTKAIKYTHKIHKYNIYVQFNIYNGLHYQALQENSKPYFTTLDNLQVNFDCKGFDKSDRMQAFINISIKKAKKLKKMLTY